MNKRKISFYVLIALIVTLLIGAVSYAATSGTRRMPGTNLTYYLTVKYDGVDKDGLESSDTEIVDINSDIIEVKDKLPEGLEFVDFVHIDSGVFAATSRGGTASFAISGEVIDDTNDPSYTSGTWDSTNTEYTYHGLHYNADTREITFRVKNLTAGCQITIGIVAKLPSTVDDPGTTDTEIRRDFYNSATYKENETTGKSNTTHDYILEDLIDDNDPDQNGENAKRKVTYEYADDSPIKPDILPDERTYMPGATVSVESDLPNTGNYRFVKWTSEDVTIGTDGTFEMPDSDIVIKGKFEEIPDGERPEKHKVTYVISGTSPAGFLVPAEKSYEAGKLVRVDSLADGYEMGGYRFKGWQNTSGVSIDAQNSFEMPDSDVTFTGSWELIKYEVSYQFEGEVPPGVTPPATRGVAPGTTVSTDVPEDQGLYIFQGWDRNDFEMPEEDVVVKGRWTKATDTFEPTITLEVVNQKDPYKKGEVVQYKVTITNNETHPINDVTVKTNTPGIPFNNLSGADAYTDEEFLIREIPAGETVEITYEYVVKDGDANPLENTIELINAEYIDTTDAKHYALSDDDYERSISVNIDLTQEAEKVKVSFNSNGGSGNMADVEVYKGTNFTLPDSEFTAPENKQFSKWDKGDVGTTIKVDADIELVAQWADAVYKITVTDDGNGTATASANQGRTGDEITLTATPKTGYKFKSWEIVSGDADFDVNTITIKNSDVTIKANFAPVSTTQFTVEFETNGGSTIDDVTVYEGTVLDKPTDPTKQDYVFGKWYTDDTLTTEYDFSQPVTGDMKLYASWDDDANNNGEADATELFTVIYKDGDTELKRESDLGVGDAVAAYTPTKTDYVFEKWTPDFQNTVRAADANADSEIIYTAVWKDDKNNNGTADENDPKYTITYKDGLDGAVFADKVFSDQLVGITTPSFGDNPKRDGYAFTGWTPSVTGVVEGNATYTATWGEDNNNDGIPDVDQPYDVKFDMNGKVPTNTPPAKQSVIYGKKVDKPDEDPTADKAIFDGWYKDAAGTQPWNFDTDTVSGHTSIYAKWLDDENKNGTPDNKEIYTIIFEPDGGSWDGSTEPKEIDYYYGKTIKIAEAPTKEGYEFDYWEGSKYYPGQAYRVVEDHKFVAVWKESSTDPSEGGGSSAEGDSAATDNNNKDSKTDNGKGAPTGDETNIMYFLIVLGISIMAFVVLMYSLKGNSKKKGQRIISILLAYFLLLSICCPPQNVHALTDYSAYTTEIPTVTEDIEINGHKMTVTQEGRWVAPYEVEYKITVDTAPEPQSDYDQVLIGADYYSAKEIHDALNNGYDTSDYQMAATRIKDILDANGYTFDQFRYASMMAQKKAGKSNVPLDLPEKGYWPDLDPGVISEWYREGPGDKTFNYGDDLLHIINRAANPEKNLRYDYDDYHVNPDASHLVPSDKKLLIILFDYDRDSLGRGEVMVIMPGDSYTFERVEALNNRRDTIKEYFPNATVVSVRNGFTSNNTYADYFADMVFSKEEVLESGFEDRILPMNSRYKLYVREYFSDAFEYISSSTHNGSRRPYSDSVTWDIGPVVSGTKQEITIRLRLKDEYKNCDYVPLNRALGITARDASTGEGTTISATPTAGTPVLATGYTVTYENVGPGGSSLDVPAEKTYPAGQVVQMDSNEPSCDGYDFKGYEIEGDGVRMVTDDSFIMPARNVTIRAIWGKTSVEKSSDGTTFSANYLNMAQYINYLHKVEGADGLADSDPDSNVRYIGANPDNYVTFNNETWRIIGVFDVDDGSGNVEQRVKIVRNTTLGQYSWDMDSWWNNGEGINQWGPSGGHLGANLMLELNGDYLNYQTSGQVKWWTGNKDYEYSWFYYNQALRPEAIDMIDNALWHTSASNYQNGTPLQNINQARQMSADEVYTSERGENTGKGSSSSFQNDDTVTRTFDWTGKVALIYPSDFLYSFDGGNSWLNKGTRYFTLSPFYMNGNGEIITIVSGGVLDWSDTSGAYPGRANPVTTTFPSVYLRNNVYIESGSGTSSDPYVLELGD